MPTGYTAGIIDGEITTFDQFAKKCIRAFGVAVHMRDEDSDKEFKPREPNDYYEKELKEAKSNLANLNKMSDEEIINQEKEKTESSIEYYIKDISKKKVIKFKLEKMLNHAKNWEPPTKEHTYFRKFMIEQLETTISHDADIEYSVKHLRELRESLNNINAKSSREFLEQMYLGEIERYEDEVEKEIKRCAESTKWVNDLMESLNKQKTTAQ